MKKTLRVAAYAVCVENEEVLLAHFVGRRSRHWTLPGGGVEHGEHPLDTVVREVFEETGYEVRVDALLGVDSLREEVPGRVGAVDFHALRLVYAATVIGGEMRFEENGTTDMAAWVPLAEVADLPRGPLVNTALELARVRPPTGRLTDTYPA
ncbi:NUDIX domain-containing protein [Actinokineospora bangkokensis]|uniref:NUDIX hydrolase n=1 Tax=Actinokineospora bangkokensis TaxID=1193682 RepID=A0A1Q9LRI9_9PSEU|nr:NUDIX hydrolase [Actinokineospora bangkokensis]OLR94623.1 NUDIX hydrolase [Actinokineospora bangkokensis]